MRLLRAEGRVALAMLTKVASSLARFASSGAAPTLNFTPMDGVMSQLVVKFREEGEIIARIFPPEQGVLLAWSKIVFSELVSRVSFAYPILITD